MKRFSVLALKALGIFQPVFDVYETARRWSWQQLRRRRRFIRNLGASEWPLPSMVLTTSVAGSPDAGWFLESGEAAAQSMREALARSWTDLDHFDRILDFGCGCGRVLRHLPKLTRAALFGADVNRRAIRWSRKNLPFGRFVTNRLTPPLPFDAKAFDLVYSLSVFTHLTWTLQDAWAREISRVLRPGGLLVVSLNGVESRKDMTASEAASFDSGHLVVRAPEATGSNRCAAYHPKSYVVGHFLSEWQLVEHRPGGARGNPPQDLYVFRNGPSTRAVRDPPFAPPPSPPSPAPSASG